MFLKTSRYYRLDDLTVTGKFGEKIAGKSIRLLPQVQGLLEHPIEDSDRLDHLAYKYYKESRKWWRICDANENASPLELLGKTPMVTHRFEIQGEDENAFFPWNHFIGVLDDVIGIDAVIPDEQVSLVQVSRAVGQDSVLVEAERFSRAVLVRHNRENVTAEQLQSLWEDQGYVLNTPETIRVTGKTLMIPSKTT